MDLYSARIHQLSGAQGALLPLLIRLIHHSWNHLSSLGSIQLNCCHYSAYRAGANQPTLPSQVPIWPLGGEKQLWLSVKDISVTAGIRTHILLLTPELESGKLDHSATTLPLPLPITKIKKNSPAKFHVRILNQAIADVKEIVAPLHIKFHKSQHYTVSNFCHH